MKSHWSIPVIGLVAVLGSAHASEPTPLESRWSQVVFTLVEALTQNAENTQFADFSTPGAWIAPFAMNRSESVMLLPERLGSNNVVSAHAYIHPSVSSASDIVADLLANGSIDPNLLRRLQPQDPAELRKADATMARWFAAALEAQAGDPVAVMVLYDDAKTDPLLKPTLTFVLIRGEVDASDTPRISRMLYGPMQSAVK